MSTHRQSYKDISSHPTHRQGQLIEMAMLGVNSSTACMKLGLVLMSWHLANLSTLSMSWAVDELAFDELAVDEMAVNEYKKKK